MWMQQACGCFLWCTAHQTCPCLSCTFTLALSPRSRAREHTHSHAHKHTLTQCMHTRPRTSGSGCHDPPRGARLLGGRLPGAAHGNSPEQRVLRERSGVYWKPKGAAAKRAGPKQRVLRSLRATQGDLVCMYQHKKQPGCAVRGFLLLVSRKDKGFDSAKTLHDHRVLPSRLQVPAQLITVHR